MVLARVADFFSASDSTKAQLVDDEHSVAQLDVPSPVTGTMGAAVEPEEVALEAKRPPYIHVRWHPARRAMWCSQVHRLTSAV